MLQRHRRTTPTKHGIGDGGYARPDGSRLSGADIGSTTSVTDRTKPAIKSITATCTFDEPVAGSGLATVPLCSRRSYWRQCRRPSSDCNCRPDAYPPPVTRITPNAARASPHGPCGGGDSNKQRPARPQRSARPRRLRLGRIRHSRRRPSLHHRILQREDRRVPADNVIVTEQLSPNLNWSTFQLGTIGFGSYVVNVPPGLTSYSTRVDAMATLGVYVDIDASLNLSTGLLTVTFTSLDPTTLDTPSNPLVGFLPPDTDPPNGEGYINYTIQPKAGLATGAT